MHNLCLWLFKVTATYTAYIKVKTLLQTTSISTFRILLQKYQHFGTVTESLYFSSIYQLSWPELNPHKSGLPNNVKEENTIITLLNHWYCKLPVHYNFRCCAPCRVAYAMQIGSWKLSSGK